jgi:methionyl-tRNA formyltransferase
MRLVYMGTPQFAVPPLLALAEAGHEIAGVVTRTDKPAGRGRSVAAPPVKAAALRLGLRLYQPRRVREPEFIETLRKINPEVIVVAAYGQILPKDILTLPGYGCVNIHASLLPAYRGAAPVNWAIIRGDRETGVTIMQMDEGMDTGGVLMQEGLPIEPKDTAGTLTEKLSVLGARLVVKALPLIETGALKPMLQNGTNATFAPILKKEDGLVNWTHPALGIYNLVRGVTPWPGAYSFLDGSLIKILETEAVAGSGEPGMLYRGSEGALEAGTGNGRLRLLRVQPAGKKPMLTADFLRGHRGIEGKQFSDR